MRVNFVTVADDRLASYRYRIETPALELAKKGYEVTIGEFDDRADIVVFSKHFNMEVDYRLIQRCRERGIKTVFDICDNHFSDSLASYYISMSKLADKVIVGTSELMLKLEKEVIHKTFVINDPYEYPLKEPRFSPEEDPKLLWFGHPSNLYSLERVLPEIEEYELRIISNTDRFPAIPWSQRAVMEGFDWCDLVIMPATDPCKGNNRAMESFRQGRMVIGEMHPAMMYLPVWTGGIREGITWAMNNPKQVLGCIEQAQLDIDTLYSPENIGTQWERVLA